MHNDARSSTLSSQMAGQPRPREAWRELLKHVAVPNDAMRRINAFLDGEDYIPAGVTIGAPDPRDVEIDRLRAELAAKEASPAESPAAPAAVEAPSPQSQESSAVAGGTSGDSPAGSESARFPLPADLAAPAAESEDAAAGVPSVEVQAPDDEVAPSDAPVSEGDGA